MIVPLEDRWGILSVLEYEHGAKKALLSLRRKDLLKFAHTCAEEQEVFLSDTGCAYAVSSFRQGKEFFRHAETSNWLAKPLLLYYGMLAVVKGALVFEFPDYFCDRKHLRHGISAGDRAKTAIDFRTEYINVHETGVFPLGRAAFEQVPFAKDTRLFLTEILTRLPEVDATYRHVFGRHDDPLGYVKIEGSVLYRDPQEQRIRLGFHLPPDLFDGIKERLPATVVENAEIGTIDISGKTRVSFKSKQSWDNESAAMDAIPRSLTPTLDNNFALILPIEKSGKKYEVSELELIYLGVFYFSSLARYQPHLWLDLQAGTENLGVLLCQDVLRSSENKFLALLQRELHYAGLLPLVESIRALVPQEAQQPIATVRNG